MSDQIETSNLLYKYFIFVTSSYVMNSFLTEIKILDEFHYDKLIFPIFKSIRCLREIEPVTGVWEVEPVTVVAVEGLRSCSIAALQFLWYYLFSSTLWIFSKSVVVALEIVCC